MYGAWHIQADEIPIVGRLQSHITLRRLLLQMIRSDEILHFYAAPMRYLVPTFDAFEIKNNDIIFSNCAFTTGSSDLHFDGTVSNFFPFLYSALTDSTRVKQKIGLNATLVSDKLVWEDLVGKTTASQSTDDFSIPAVFYRLSGSVSGNVKVFSY